MGFAETCIFQNGGLKDYEQCMESGNRLEERAEMKKKKGERM